MDAWQGTQAEFVDDPASAIDDADRLIQDVMRSRGYPVEDFDDRASLVSVEHPEVVERYRRAHAIAVSNDDGGADTEDLRIAMQDFRALFVELVEKDTVDGVAGTRPSGTLGVCHLAAPRPLAAGRLPTRPRARRSRRAGRRRRRAKSASRSRRS